MAGVSAKYRAYQAAWAREKRAKDPEYAERLRVVSRKRHRVYRETSPAYVEQNKARCRRYGKAYRERVQARVPETRIPYRLSMIKKNARVRNLEFSLPDALAFDLITDNCFYCGSSAAPDNGIDRVDSARGYVEDNVVTACAPCNKAKLDRSLSDFVSWSKRVAVHCERYAIA